jgi:hypothetical protein
MNNDQKTAELRKSNVAACYVVTRYKNHRNICGTKSVIMRMRGFSLHSTVEDFYGRPREEALKISRLLGTDVTYRVIPSSFMGRCLEIWIPST